MPMEEVGRLSLVVGPLTEDPEGNGGPYGSPAYLDPTFKYHYIFHASYSDVDKSWNAPGVFPGHEAILTSDMFPLICHRYTLSVGPLLAKSRAEYVFLSTAKGDLERGLATQIGLLRVSRLSSMKGYGGGRINDPVYGEMKRGDLSLWKQYHHPPVEEYVRLRFPDDHAHAPALLYDFKVNRVVSCVPTLVALMTGPAHSAPIFPDEPESQSLTGHKPLPSTLVVEPVGPIHVASRSRLPTIAEEESPGRFGESSVSSQQTSILAMDDRGSATSSRDVALVGRSSQTSPGTSSVVEINIARPIRPLPRRPRLSTTTFPFDHASTSDDTRAFHAESS